MSSSFIENNQQAVEALTRYYIQNTFQRSARIDHTVEHALQETLESMYIPHEDSDIKIESCQKIIEFSEYIAGKVVLYMADKENPQREHDKNQILREIGWSYYGRFDFPRKERNKKTNKMEEVFREYLYVYIDPVGFDQGWEFLQVCAGPNPLLKTKDGTPITDPSKIDKFACNFTMVSDIEEAVQFALDEEPRPGFFFKQTPAQISSAIAFVSDIKRLPAYIVSKVIPFYQKIIDTELEARNVARQREAVEKRYEDAVIYGAAEVVEPEETPEVSHYGMTDGDEDSFEFLDGGGDDDREAEDDAVEDADNDETPSSPIQPAVDSQSSGTAAVDDNPAGTSGRHEAPRRGFFQRLRDSIQRPVNDTVAPAGVMSPLGIVSEEQEESPADANSDAPAVEETGTETVGDIDVTVGGRHRKDDADDDTDADAITEDTELEDADNPDSEESFESISETFNWGSVSAQYPADNHTPLGAHDSSDSADEADPLDAGEGTVIEVDGDSEEIVNVLPDSEEDDADGNDSPEDAGVDNDSEDVEQEQESEEEESETREDSTPAPAVEAKFTDDSTAIISLKQIGVSENDRILLDPKKHIDGDDDWMKGSK